MVEVIKEYFWLRVHMRATPRDAWLCAIEVVRLRK